MQRIKNMSEKEGVIWISQKERKRKPKNTLSRIADSTRNAKESRICFPRNVNKKNLYHVLRQWNHPSILYYIHIHYRILAFLSSSKAAARLTKAQREREQMKRTCPKYDMAFIPGCATPPPLPFFPTHNNNTIRRLCLTYIGNLTFLGLLFWEGWRKI